MSAHFSNHNQPNGLKHYQQKAQFLSSTLRLNFQPFSFVIRKMLFCRKYCISMNI